MRAATIAATVLLCAAAAALRVPGIDRRQFLATSALTAAAPCAKANEVAFETLPPPKPQPALPKPPLQSPAPVPSASSPPPPVLPPVNVSEAIATQKVTVRRRESLLLETVVDPKTLDQVREFRIPNWWPKPLRPPRWTVRKLTAEELAISGALAGGATELLRTLVLHPLTTVKSRLQARPQGVSFTDAITAGNSSLFAGLVPALLVAVPSAAAWFGARDLIKKEYLLALAPAAGSTGGSLFMSDLSLNLLAFALASTAEGIVRAPADVLVTRAQVGRGRSFTPQEDDEQADAQAALGLSIREGLSKVPILLAADLPYVLSRTVVVAALRELLASDSTSLQPLLTMATQASPLFREQALFVTAAVVTALITTPLDVARTRLLLERAEAASLTTGGGDGGGGGGGGEGGAPLLPIQSPARLWESVAAIGRDEGVEALFRGSLLRVLYTGVVVAALIPIRSVGYVAVRDWFILESF